MDIPEAARTAKRARTFAEFPSIARYPQVFDQYIETALIEEWEADPLFYGVSAEQDSGIAVLKFHRTSSQGSPVSVRLTFPEAMDLYTKIGILLFGE
jgi:hypothetical protein